MSLKTFEYLSKEYPEYEREGFAAQFCFPFAKQVCRGVGYDIGCMKKEWALPGAIPVDICFNEEYTATHLGDNPVDYIFSSHCLEHLTSWVEALEYWTTKLKDKGVLFLYLPHYSQEYWRPWHNKKHLHCLDPQIITRLLEDKGYHKIYCSGVDLNHSFTIMGEKI